MDLNTFLDAQLYPTVYNNASIVFPEFQFTQKKGHWVSTNKLKITGETGDSKSKVYLWEKAPFCLKDFTRGSHSIFNYVMDSSYHSPSDFNTALTYLCGLVGIEAPRGDKSYTNEAEKWEELSEYFRNHLLNSNEAEAGRSYLKSRGITKETINQFDIGYLPPIEQITREFSKDNKILELMKSKFVYKDNWGMTFSHKLYLPWRSLGKIRGCIVRSIEGDDPKYLYSRELSRNKYPFNLQSISTEDKLYISEGIFDSISLSRIGFSSIATGSASVSNETINYVKSKNISSIILAFDSDEAGKKGKNKFIYQCKKELLTSPLFIDLPENFKDVDEYINDGNVEAIENPIPSWKYLANGFESKKPENEIQKNTLFENIKSGANSLYYQVDRHLFIHNILKKYNLDEYANDVISQSDLNVKKGNEVDLEQEKQKIKGLIDKSQNLKEIKDKIHKISIASESDYSKYLSPNSLSDVSLSLSSQSDGLRTGYYFGDDELELPPAQISIVAGPTGHGKTTVLINLILNVAKNHPDKKFYFFTLEERQEIITLNTFNTFLNLELSKNNRKSLFDYFKNNSTRYFHREYNEEIQRNKFLSALNEFDNDLLLSGRININSWDASSSELLDLINELGSKKETGGIFIDYMQLLRKDSKFYNRYDELKEICADILRVTENTKLPIILAAQFNREVISPLHLHETTIGEAGDIERVANLILGIWNTDRNSKYTSLTKSQEQELDKLGLKEKSKMYIKVLKSRRTAPGKEGVFDYNGNTGKIAPSVKQYDSEYALTM